MTMKNAFVLFLGALLATALPASAAGAELSGTHDSDLTVASGGACPLVFSELVCGLAGFGCRLVAARWICDTVHRPTLA
ncbi:MAG: hypothetical protein ACT4PT_06590 [Methanobacteriota archaeon]